MKHKRKKFGPVRQRALKFWQEESKRSRQKIAGSDNFTGSIECKWQRKAYDKSKHVSLFCGIGEWSNHITDALLDESCDNLTFNTTIEGEQRRLFRFYCRIMFAIAETLNDFEESLSSAYIESFIKQTGDTTIPTDIIDTKKIACKKQKVRGLLGDSVNNFQDFVNRIVKHKSNNVFKADHHLPIMFEDRDNPSDQKLISIETDLRQIGTNNYDAILAPKLEWLISLLLNSYSEFDRLITENQQLFDLICDPYSIEIAAQ